MKNKIHTDTQPLRWRILVLLMAFVVAPGVALAQTPTDDDDDTFGFEPDPVFEPAPNQQGSPNYSSLSVGAIIDTLEGTRQQLFSLKQQLSRMTHLRDSLYENSLNVLELQRQIERISRVKDSLEIANFTYQKELKEKNSLLQEQLNAMKEREALIAEKEKLYRDATLNNTIDRTKLESEVATRNVSIEAKTREIEYLQRDIESKNRTMNEQKENYERLVKERNYYSHLVDSLRVIVNKADLEAARKNEETKFLRQKVQEAEARNAEAAGKRKKIRPIQGVALRFKRSPSYELLMQYDKDDKVQGQIVSNRNGGSVEFDYVTGASVMLWDLTPIFNKKPDPESEEGRRHIPRFDQQFNYDLGFYVGFGGSNLFKNFYVGFSFRFIDYFYFVGGVNIAEYQTLRDGFKEGGGVELSTKYTINNVTSTAWEVHPFVALAIDLDFLSSVKK